MTRRTAAEIVVFALLAAALVVSLVFPRTQREVVIRGHHRPTNIGNDVVAEQGQSANDEAARTALTDSIRSGYANFANGQIPRSALVAIPGSGPDGHPHLRPDSARLFNAMYASARRDGVDLSIHEGSVRRAYRPLSSQYLARSLYGSGAAVPGTSDHGWGMAVDFMNHSQVSWIANHPCYGTRATVPGEWWHYLIDPSRATCGHSAAAPFRSLRLHSTGPRVRRVQRALYRRGFRSVPHGRRSPGYGYFGRSTRSAVVRFQRRHSLYVDGVVGVRTWRALHA